MSRTVLCGVDDSDGARAAIRVAAGVAEALDAELVLMHVAAGSVVLGASAIPGGQEQLDALALRGAEAVLDRVADDSGQTTARLRPAVGPAVDVLRQAAVDEGALFLVVGSRGQGHVRQALLGSVSGALGRDAPCPVVIVPPGAAELSVPLPTPGRSERLFVAAIRRS
jgi:nucleotide-binding universal stress UspA family protein